MLVWLMHGSITTSLRGRQVVPPNINRIEVSSRVSVNQRPKQQAVRLSRAAKKTTTENCRVENLLAFVVISGNIARMGNHELSPGSLFANRFEIQRAAGRGGMGTVYRAIDRYSGDVVGLKLLHPGMVGEDEAERFAREGRMLAELRHPGIVAHVAHGQTPDGQLFLAMEWLNGIDLSQRLMQGPLVVQDCVRLAEQIADALMVAHQHDIIHRDLKPSNLFLVDGDVGRVKILDFGIARRLASSQAMTKTGMLVGTPEYMAPEQARGERILTPVVDMFSVGCVLYECLTGTPPFAAAHIAAVLVRILFEDPVPIDERRPGIPASLTALIARLLHKDPALRVVDAAALRGELSRLGDLHEIGSAATIASVRPKAASFAEEEQGLFSIVLAAPAEEIEFGATNLANAPSMRIPDRQVLLQSLANLGGTADFLANGTLVVTVSPMGNAQDQAVLAARAALIVKEQWPEALVSMATGRGSIRGRTAVGEVVELAAQSLKSGSQPFHANPTTGAVLIDSLSAKLLEGRFVQTPRPGGAWLLHEEREVDAGRLLLGKPTPCVGRDAELGTLELQLAGCIEDSEARAVVITAPPGIGKSRLRHEFLRRLDKRDEPVTVLLGRGDMMSAGASYEILASAIRRLSGLTGAESGEVQRERLRARLGEHVAAADRERVVLFVGELCNARFSDEGILMLQAARQDPKIMRERVRRAVLDFFAAECAVAPVLVCLDDLQWGDELTVSVLDEALREQAGAPLFVLAFARPELHEVFPKLWQKHKIQEIALKGLSKKACERLIQQVLGKDVPADAVARSVEQSAGNALFLEELIRSIAERKSHEQSETVVAMLQARMGRLDAGPRRVLRAASIFGQTCWQGGVAAILDMPSTAPEIAAWLSVLVAAEMIQPHAQSRLATQSEYGFRHALLHDAAYGLLTENDIMTGHRLAGVFLEEAGEPNAAMIANHFERGDEPQKAARFYLLAAENSLEQFDLTGAMRYVDRGLACTPEREVLGKLRGIECFTAGNLSQYARISPASESALEIVSPGSLAWCRIVSSAITAAMIFQDAARLNELFSRFLTTEPDDNAQAAYLDAMVYMGAALTAGAPAPIVDMLLRRITDCVERWAPNTPTFRRFRHIICAQMTALRQPKPWTLVTEGETAFKLAREVGDRILELGLPSNLIPLGWLDLGDRERIQAHLQAIEPLLLQSQVPALIGLFRFVWGLALADAADERAWSEAERVVTPALSTPDDVVSYLGATGIMARVALRRGQMDSAEAHSRVVNDQLMVAPVWFLSHTSVLIQALLGLGRAIDATQLAEQMLSLVSGLGGAGVFEVELRVAASEAFHAAGDIGRAQTELRETLRQIQVRVDDITDPFWKNSYLTRNRHCVQALRLAREWGIHVEDFSACTSAA